MTKNITLKQLRERAGLVPICQRCWNKRNPNNKVRLDDKITIMARKCYFCGEIHRSGIFIKKNERTFHPHKVKGGDA